MTDVSLPYRFYVRLHLVESLLWVLAFFCLVIGPLDVLTDQTFQDGVDRRHLIAVNTMVSFTEEAIFCHFIARILYFRIPFFLGQIFVEVKASTKFFIFVVSELFLIKIWWSDFAELDLIVVFEVPFDHELEVYPLFFIYPTKSQIFVPNRVLLIFFPKYAKFEVCEILVRDPEPSLVENVFIS